MPIDATFVLGVFDKEIAPEPLSTAVTPVLEVIALIDAITFCSGVLPATLSAGIA